MEKQTAQIGMKENVKHQEIAARAYQIWESSGRPPGCEMKNWLEAEKQLMASQNAKLHQARVAPKVGANHSTEHETSSHPVAV
jgi:hypothetical protein